MNMNPPDTELESDLQQTVAQPLGEGENAFQLDQVVVEKNEYKNDDKSVASSHHEDTKEHQKECRICLSTEDGDLMVQPCMCKGSLQWAHVSCLQSWVHERRQLLCEICKSTYKEEYLPTLENELYTRHSQSTMESGQPTAEDRSRRRRMLKTFVIVTVIVLTLIATLVVLGLNANNHTWAAIALRVIAFGLPMIIILRCFLLWFQGRGVYR